MPDLDNFATVMDRSQYHELVQSLRVLLREEVSHPLILSSCRIRPFSDVLPAEEEIIRKAAPGRRHEFSAGRWCAGQCLAHYGIARFPLVKGAYGEPLWPQACSGSITHHAGLALAVTMPRDEGLIGIDLVDLNDEPPDPETILNPAERHIRFTDRTENQVLLAFSLKESIIKILSPMLQQYIEFRDINIRYENNTTEISYRGHGLDMRLYWLVHGHYAFTLATGSNG